MINFTNGIVAGRWRGTCVGVAVNFPMLFFDGVARGASEPLAELLQRRAAPERPSLSLCTKCSLAPPPRRAVRPLAQELAEGSSGTYRCRLSDFTLLSTSSARSSKYGEL